VPSTNTATLLTGCDELAEAVRWAGEVTVDPLVGIEIVTPAHDEAAQNKIMAEIVTIVFISRWLSGSLCMEFVMTVIETLKIEYEVIYSGTTQPHGLARRSQSNQQPTTRRIWRP
jgi:hypothetical protein